MEHRRRSDRHGYIPAVADKAIWRFARDVDGARGRRAIPCLRSRQRRRLAFYLWTIRSAILRAKASTGRRRVNAKLKLEAQDLRRHDRAQPELENSATASRARQDAKIKLGVGPRRPNRTVLWPFKAQKHHAPSRKPRNGFSLQRPGFGRRSGPAPNQARGICRLCSMEFLIAASHSNDPVMLDFYQSGDPYLSFAKRVGAAPSYATKRLTRDCATAIRRACSLSSTASKQKVWPGRLGVSTFEAHEMIAQHRALFARYWQWSDDWLAAALDSGRMWTPLGWQCRTGVTEFNERSIKTFRCKGPARKFSGLFCIWATRHGLRSRAPVHDALLIEAPLI